MKKDDEARRIEAERILRQVERETKGVADSSMARQLEHRLFDTASSDPAERWGKIIGRSLGFLFLIYLVYHLLTTYVLN